MIACLRRILEVYPGRGMVTGALQTTHGLVDASGSQPRDECFADQKMIDAHAGITWPPVSQVTPEGVRRPLAVDGLERVCPSLLHQYSEHRARLRP